MNDNTKDRERYEAAKSANLQYALSQVNEYPFSMPTDFCGCEAWLVKDATGHELEALIAARKINGEWRFVSAAVLDDRLEPPAFRVHNPTKDTRAPTWESVVIDALVEVAAEFWEPSAL